MATRNQTTDFPVPGFPMKFTWQTNAWFDLFEQHVEYIQNELRRAQAEGRVIVYLSCPISSRGGGHHSTNVDIANHTARRLMSEWGPKYFILNPSQYQLESKEGTGLITQHAEKLRLQNKPVNLQRLQTASPPGGGDYMRMWTRVLVEDSYLHDKKRRNLNLGGLFDAFYFLSPGDMRDFFTKGGATTVTAGIEEYFARQYAIDRDFHVHFTPPKPKKSAAMDRWSQLRSEFFRFYAVRASGYFSKGCMDEWNIWVELNRGRLASKKYGVGEQIAGFFEGRQVSPGSAATPIPKGYAV